LSSNLASIVRNLVIGLFVLLTAIQANKKFVLDEIDFPTVALATSQSGIPIYYRGELTPEHIGIYHPPMYIYALAGFIKIFGFSEIGVRAFGVICTLITVFLLLKIGQLLLPEAKSARMFPVIAVAIFLLHPYTIANTTLPDIDQTVLPVAILLYLVFILKYCVGRGEEASPFVDVKTNGLSFIVSASLLFCLALWTKLTTPIALIPLTACILLVSGSGWLLALGFAGLIAAVGICLFGATYYLFCNATGLPYSYTLDFLLQSFSKGTSGGSGTTIFSKIALNFAYGLNFATWMTSAFISLVSFVFSSMAFDLGKSSKMERLALLLGCFGMGVTVFYVGLIAPFGGFFKYPYATFSLVIIPIGVFIGKDFSAGVNSQLSSANRTLNSKSHYAKFLEYFVYLTLGTCSVFYALLITKDNAFFAGGAMTSNWFFAASGVGVVLAVIWKFTKPNFFKRIGLYSLVIIQVSFGTSLAYLQATAPYPTKYEYGQKGLDQVTEYLRSKVGSTEPIWSMKDVGFYTRNRYVENYGDVLLSTTKDQLLSRLQLATERNKVRYFVVTESIGQDRIDAYAPVKLALDECCDFERKFDNFLIYKLKQP
jgi:hypothetical protein